MKNRLIYISDLISIIRHSGISLVLIQSARESVTSNMSRKSCGFSRILSNHFIYNIILDNSYQC